jgi:hypothetical protein
VETQAAEVVEGRPVTEENSMKVVTYPTPGGRSMAFCVGK